MGKTRKQRIKNNSRAKTIKNNKQLVNVRENLDGGAFTGRSYREGVYDMWYKELQKNNEFNIIRGFLRKTCLFFLRGTYVQVVGNNENLLTQISSKLSTVKSFYPFSKYSDNWKSGNIDKVHKALRAAGDSPGIQSNIKNNKALYFHSGNPLSRTGQSNEVDDFLYMIQSVVGMSNSIENMTIAKYKDDLGFEGMSRFRAYGVLGVTEKLSQKWTGSNRDSEYFKKFRELAFLSEESKKSDRFNKYNFLDENNILEYIIYLLILSYPQGVEYMRLREDNKPETLKNIIRNLIEAGVLYDPRDFADVEAEFKKPQISSGGEIKNITSIIIPPGGLQGTGQQAMERITNKELWTHDGSLYQGSAQTKHSATDPLTPEASSDILFWRTGFAHALTELAQRLLFTKEDIEALIARPDFYDVSLKGVKPFPERKYIMSVTSLLLLRYLTLEQGDKGAGAKEMMSNSTESPDVWSQGNQLPKIVLMMRLFRFVCLQDPGVGKFWRKRATISGGAKDDYSDDVIVGGDMPHPLRFNKYKFNTSTIRMNNRLNEAAAQLFINRDIQINIEPKPKK